MTKLSQEELAALDTQTKRGPTKRLEPAEARRRSLAATRAQVDARTALIKLHRSQYSALYQEALRRRLETTTVEEARRD